MDVRFRTVKMKKAKGFLCFIWLLIMVVFFYASTLGMSTQTDLEVKKILSRLNKTPLKAIKVSPPTPPRFLLVLLFCVNGGY
jgi:hypothetical protein